MNNPLISVLRIRSFLFLWLAEVFAQVATNMVNFVLIIVAYELTKSNTAVSGVVLSYTVPAIAFGMLAGVLVDRWKKKKVLLITNFLRMILVILLVFLKANLVFVYVISFAISIATQFFIPAESPMIPITVPKKHLYAANALFGLAIYGSVLIAFVVSSPLLLLYGTSPMFFFIAFLFFLASLFVLYIKIPAKNKRENENEFFVIKDKTSDSIKTTIGDELKNLTRLVMRTKQIYHSLLLLALSQILTLLLAVIGPGYASDVLGIKVDSFPLIFLTPAALGVLVGAILLVNLFHTHDKRRSATIGVFLLSATVLLLYLAPYLSKWIRVFDVVHLVVFFAFITGFANALIYVPSNTILQEETSDRVRGKVYGALNALVGIFSLLPIIVVGRLADVLGVGSVLITISILLFTLGVLRLLFADGYARSR